MDLTMLICIVCWIGIVVYLICECVRLYIDIKEHERETDRIIADILEFQRSVEDAREVCDEQERISGKEASP